MPTINPPWRFDPFQMPVNVNWGGGYIAIYSTDPSIQSSDTPWKPLKFNPNTGAIMWQGGPEDLIFVGPFAGFCVDSKGCIVVASQISSGLGPRIDGTNVQKISSDGKKSLWTLFIPPTDAQDLSDIEYMGIDANDNVYIQCSFSHRYPTNPSAQQTIFKIDTDGKVVDSKHWIPFGGPIDDTGSGDAEYEIDYFAVSPKGTAVGVGESYGPYAAAPYMFTGTATGSFTQNWVATMPNAGPEVAQTWGGEGIAIDENGNVYTGTAMLEETQLPDPPYQRRFWSNWLAKLNGQGGGYENLVVYSSHVEDTGVPVGTVVSVLDCDSKGNVYVATSDGPGTIISTHNIHLKFLTSTGGEIWDKFMGNDVGSGGVVACEDGVIGYDNSMGGTVSKWSSKDGSLVWNNPHLGPNITLNRTSRPQYKIPHP